MQVTQLLERASQGDSRARADLICLSYYQLRTLAAAHMRDERPDHSLTATALVHEVSLQLLAGAAVTANNEGQFLALAAKAMRNLLIHTPRRRGRQRAGGGARKLSLKESLAPNDQSSHELVDLNEALER